MNDDAVKADVLVEEVSRRRGEACPGCGSTLSSRAFLYSFAMGFKDRPRCPHCLAAALGQEPAEFRAHLDDYLVGRPCYREALSRLEGSTVVASPSSDPEAPSDPVPNADAEWDAGDAGCGDLALELRMRVESLPTGRILHLRATDPGAAEDIPAWCRMTGNPLLRVVHPEYWIRKG